MIICNSNNFAVTRAPKTGGASLQMYFLESGLINPETDSYTLEGSFDTWQEFKAYSDANENLLYKNLSDDLHGYKSLKNAQKTYAEVVEEELADADMPWVGSIRNPLEWLGSLFYYAQILRKLKIKERGDIYSTFDTMMMNKVGMPDAAWDFVFIEQWDNVNVQNSLKPQSSYYPDHAQLFNIENINEHARAFIEEKGGSVLKEMNVRRSDNDNTWYLNNLSEDRKQKSLEIYAKDFELWEKAYAVYN